MRLVDAADESQVLEFLITPKAANCARLMHEKGIPVLCVEEVAHLLSCSKKAAERGLGGLTVAGLSRLCAGRYAGRDLQLRPLEFVTVEESCISSSTSSGSASQPEPDAPTSTETSSSPPVEDASETPDSWS